MRSRQPPTVAPPTLTVAPPTPTVAPPTPTVANVQCIIMTIV